jgi:uncharacterized protein
MGSIPYPRAEGSEFTTDAAGRWQPGTPHSGVFPFYPAGQGRGHMEAMMQPGVDHLSSPSSHEDLGPLDLSRIAQDLQIRKTQVESVVQLLDEGNTIPFITRYRKERTGGLDEEALRTIQQRIAQLRQLADRKRSILRMIEGQGRLSDELRAAILAADNPKRLEDLYLPYKPKKRTLASAAREKGLEPLAMAIWYADPAVANLDEVLPTLVDPERGRNNPEEIRQGVQHILAEVIAESADVRAVVRSILWETGRLCTRKSDKLPEGKGLEYKGYFSFNEPIRELLPHRILAINRGEKEHALTVKTEWDEETGQRVALERLPLPPPGTPLPPLPELRPSTPPALAPESQATCCIEGGADAPPHPVGIEGDTGVPPPSPANTTGQVEQTGAVPPEAPVEAATSELPSQGSEGGEQGEGVSMPSSSDPGQETPPSPTGTLPGGESPAEQEPRETQGGIGDANTPGSDGRQHPLDEGGADRTQETAPHQSVGQPTAAASSTDSPASNTEQQQTTPPAQPRPATPTISPTASFTSQFLPSAPLPERGPRGGQMAALAQRAEALQQHPHAAFLQQVTADALSRLIVPSLEREIRRELSARAETHAVRVFARNLRSKFLAAPLRGRRVLAIDPAFRTGCKVVVLDELGNPVEDVVIHPHPPQNKKAEARLRLEELIRKHQTNVIAIGNGTACRETEEFVADLISHLEARRRGEVPPEAPPAPEETAPASVQECQPPPSPAPAGEGEGTSGAATEETSQEPAAPIPAENPGATEGTPAAPDPEGRDPSHVLQGETQGPPPDESAPAVVEGTPEVASAGEGSTEPASEPSQEPAAEVQAPAPASPPPAPAPNPLAGLLEAPEDLAYVVVNEAGASVYSTSPVGREEFPNYDATLRGTISIGRRLQDPLSELVKIDPQHMGVGLYQHDVNPKHLRESLEAIVESCVNTVGVDLNTASVPLLRHVSGLNQLVARDLVEYRKTHGPFRRRDQLLQVPGIGENRYVQSAGFLKIPDSDNPLDQTWIHPESYPVAEKLLEELGFEPGCLRDREKLEALREKLRGLSPEEVASRLETGVPTLQDIMEALARPGRDPREDLPPPVFKKGILRIEDLQPNMELKGTVLNVVDFGAFVDIGLKDSGLVHISQMANRYVKSPYDVVAVGDIVTVWVLAVETDRHRVSLTMIPPGTERKPPERRKGHRGGPPRREAEAGQPSPEARQGDRPRGGPRQGRGEYGGRSGPQDRGPRGDRGGPRSGGPHRGSRPPRREPGTSPPHSQPPPPRRPRRDAPKPKLSQAALSGKESLSTFGELAAFWDAKGQPPPPPKQPPTPEVRGRKTTQGAGESEAPTPPPPSSEPAHAVESPQQPTPAPEGGTGDPSTIPPQPLHSETPPAAPEVPSEGASAPPPAEESEGMSQQEAPPSD